MDGNERLIDFPAKFRFLFEPKRFKVGYGGRAGIKSWSFAQALLLQGVERPLRIICARETMKSIEDSVHKLLSDQIVRLGLEEHYQVLKKSIVGKNGTTIGYSQLTDRSVHNVKSLEGCDRLWVEEAQTVRTKSWRTVIPTIRKAGSEIWVSFNPLLEDDATYQMFVVNPPPNAVVVKTSYRDNLWLTDELKADIEHLRATDPVEFEHVYEGACKQVVEGAIYREQLIAAEKEGRMARVPYDSIKPVDVFWDLGFGDHTSAWFAQSVGFEFRVIDFMSDHLKDLSFYFKELRGRPYVYGTCYLPHDARAKTIQGGGRSVQQQFEAAGFRVKIVPQLSVADGIAAARQVFNKCIFDREKCHEGLHALKNYRYDYDDDLGTFMKEPLHDWASHPADAFRMLGVAIREPERQKQREARPPVRTSVWG